MKKVFILIMSLILCMGSAFSVDAAESNCENEVAVESQEIEVLPRSISASQTIKLKVGESWMKNFNVDVAYQDSHNTFKIIVNNVSGSSYKILVTATNNYEYETKEYTGGCTLTIDNAQPKVYYQVYVLNTGTGTLNAHVQLSSYYS